MRGYNVLLGQVRDEIRNLVSKQNLRPTVHELKRRKTIEKSTLKNKHLRGRVITNLVTWHFGRKGMLQRQYKLSCQEKKYLLLHRNVQAQACNVIPLLQITACMH